jgi:hypothetical protein
LELGNTCQIESKISKVRCRNRYIGIVLIGFMPAHGALCKAHAKGGQTLEEQGKVSLNIMVIIRNNMNHVETIKKRLQNPQKIEHR